MARWTVHLEGGPRRVNHAAVCVGDKIYSFGGYCSGDDYSVTTAMDVHVLNTVSYRWRLLPLPEVDLEENDCFPYPVPYQRYGHTAVAYGDCAYVWGGRNDCEGSCQTLYCFHTRANQWSTPAVSGNIPGARDGHSACIIKTSMYIFGGFEETVSMFSNEVHTLDFSTMQWSLLSVKGPVPKWRDFHAAIGVGDNMYVFGGRIDAQGPLHSGVDYYCNKIQILDTVSKCWHTPVKSNLKPVGRRSHSMWVHGGSLYIFGGYNSLKKIHFNDILKFDLETQVWSSVKMHGTPPTNRRRQCCCLMGNKVFLFGGTSPNPDQRNSSSDRHGNLIDNSDLHILDYEPSLKTLCCLAVVENQLPTDELPLDIRLDIAAMTTDSNISRPLNWSG